MWSWEGLQTLGTWQWSTEWVQGEKSAEKLKTPKQEEKKFKNDNVECWKEETNESEAYWDSSSEKKIGRGLRGGKVKEGKATEKCLVCGVCWSDV